jgi:hypothetical protein
MPWWGWVLIVVGAGVGVMVVATIGLEKIGAFFTGLWGEKDG